MKDQFIYLPAEIQDIKINKFGVKAANLLPHKLTTPDFIILSSDFYLGWKTNRDNFLKNNNKVINQITIHFQHRDVKQIIIRSSCANENIGDRGKYISEKCLVNANEIKKLILSIYSDFEQKNDESSISLVIQEYRTPTIQGHLSNERRIDEDKKIWLIERETGTDISTSKITVSEVASQFDFSINKCQNAKTLNLTLQFLASWFTGQENRYHLEWLWDGSYFWILQVDIELETGKGTRPGNDWREKERKDKKNRPKGKLENFEVLETVQSTIHDWHKIKCIKTFALCGLPYWEIYILENVNIINRLIKGEIDLSLISDLKKLLTSPIIIRSDKSLRSEVLLPRTETVFNMENATKFLIEKAQYFARCGLSPTDFCFLFHQFIPSAAGALSYAKPNLGRVRLDSTWGIVEGLYFHPHDSFEVKIKSQRISKKIRCKNKYIDFDAKGNWYSKVSGSNYDWKPSLSDEQIYTIAGYTQKITDCLGKPVTVMFFINDKNYYPEILPWYYSIDEIPDSNTNYTNVIFSEKRYIIESKSGFEKFKSKNLVNNPKTKLLIKLNTDLNRDIEFIEEIADYCKNNNYVVDIEGSILSHPYYVFHSKGVNVRCVDPLEASYGLKEFHKLVRDKIPVLIEGNQEKVVSAKVNSSELLGLLKEKAVEEALEFYWSKSNDSIIEEMSDILEVLLGACKAYGIEFSEISSIAANKREKRGGFEDGVILVATKENSLFQLVSKKNSLFDNIDSEIDEIKLKPAIKFFQKGQIENFRSLTEVDKIQVTYINNVASISNKFRYLLKKSNFNTVLIEYREKDILISFEDIDLRNEDENSNQLKLFD